MILIDDVNSLDHSKKHIFIQFKVNSYLISFWGFSNVYFTDTELDKMNKNNNKNTVIWLRDCTIIILREFFDKFAVL